MNGRGAGVIYQCATCRSLVAARSVLLEDGHGEGLGRVGLVCDVCGAGTWLPVAGSGGARVVDADVDAPVARPAVRELPAPSKAMVPAAATAVATSFNDEQRAHIARKLEALGPAREGAQEDLAESFAKLLGAWGNEAEHKQLLKKAATVGELAFVGQRYRLVLDAVPGDASAKRAQNDILGLAMATMSQARDLGSTTEASSTKNKVLAGGIVFLALFLLFLLIYAPRLLRTLGGEDMIDAPPGSVPVGEGGTAQP